VSAMMNRNRYSQTEFNKRINSGKNGYP